MVTKLFEVRDEGTNISAIAIKLGGEKSLSENGILAHGGWGTDPIERYDNEYVILIPITGGVHVANHDPFNWDGPRTLREAHWYIKENFDELSSGDVVDVQYILGETTHLKTSENLNFMHEKK